MDRIKYFFEDYWKIIIGVVLVFAIPITLLTIFGGNDDEMMEPGEELTEEDYELEDTEEDDYSNVETNGLITQDNYDDMAVGAGSVDEESEESEEDRGSQSAVTDIVGEEEDEESDETVLYGKLEVSDESKEIMEKNKELISKNTGSEVKGEGSIDGNYKKYREMVEDGHGCGEESTFEDCLYTAIGGYDDLIRGADGKEEEVDKILGDLSDEVKQQRGVLQNYKKGIENSKISEEQVKTNLNTTADMLITANAMQQEAIGILSKYGDFRDENGELVYDDVVKLRENAHLLHNDIEKVYDEVNRYLLNVGNQISSYE